MYENIANARKSLKQLVRITETRNIVDIEKHIDSLTEETCKYMLKMIAYGSYEDFMNKEEI